MYTLFPLFALLTAGPLATLAHGVVTSHKIRQYGPSVAERCVSKDGIDHWSPEMINPMAPIKNTYLVENSFERRVKDLKACHAFQCRSYAFEDSNNASYSQVYKFGPGDTIPFTWDFGAPHPGHANHSIVDLKSNKIVGSPLKTWSQYGASANNPPKDEVGWSIQMPDTLPEACMQPNGCVLQFYWNGSPDSLEQHYANCVDFVFDPSLTATTNRTEFLTAKEAMGNIKPALAQDSPAKDADPSKASSTRPATSQIAKTTRLPQCISRRKRS